MKRALSLALLLWLAAPQVARAEVGAPTLGAIAFEGLPAGEKPPAVPLAVGARLLARDVREAVLRLYASARWAQVQAYLEPLEPGRQGPARVRLVFVLEPIHRLAEVRFEGASGLPEHQLLSAANLPLNAEVSPEQVVAAAAAVRVAYQRAGYRDAAAVAATSRLGDAVRVEIRVVPGPLFRIGAVRFEGDPALPNRTLLERTQLALGDPLDEVALEEATSRLREAYRSQGYLKAVVAAPRISPLRAAEVGVVFPVQAGSPVRFFIRGNRAFSTRLLLGQLHLEGSETLDSQTEEELASRLRRFCIAEGFFRAAVRVAELPAKGHTDVVFLVDEGPQVRVQEVSFVGARAFASEALQERVFAVLREAINTDPEGGADPGEVVRSGVMGRVPEPPRERVRIDPVQVFDPVVYAKALRQIADLYKSEGYLGVQLGEPQLESLGLSKDRRVEKARVRIKVEEGDRVLVSRLTIEGGSQVPNDELDAALTLQVGGAFSYLTADEGRTALTQAFTRRGHFFARVEDEERFLEAQPADPKGTSRVEVRYRIVPGPLVRVGAIELIGLQRTREPLLRDLLGLSTGDLLTPEAMDQAQQSLLRTGLFYSATVAPRDPEAEQPEKTLQVTVRERPSREVKASFGFSLADGPRTSIQFTRSNLFGRNLTFNALAKANFPFLRYSTCEVKAQPAGATGLGSGDCTRVFNIPNDPLERVLDVGLLHPRLDSRHGYLRGGVDLIHERSVQPIRGYELSKYSAQAEVQLNRRRPLFTGLTYEVGYQSFATTLRYGQSLSDLVSPNREVSRLPIGDMVFGSLRSTVALDLRDDPGRPRSGFFAQASSDYLRTFSARAASNDPTAAPAPAANLIKAQLLFAGYVPLGGQSSVLLTARTGRVFHLEGTLTPGDRRFYLGGATSLRGFHEDALQPQDLVDGLRATVQSCERSLTGLGCTNRALALQAGATSQGGDEFVAAGAELRVPVSTSVELALFYDAGNLWVNPQPAFLARLFGSHAGAPRLSFRDAVGVGLRYLTPIGRIAIDLGMNLDPVSELGEPRFGPYFSIESI